MWNPTTKSWHHNAREVLEAHGLKPITLTAKEGLALINGTQFISGLGAEATKRAKNVAIVADIAGGLTLEALRGNQFSKNSQNFTRDLPLSRNRRCLQRTNS